MTLSDLAKHSDTKHRALCMAAMHLPIKFGADIFILSEVNLAFFRNSRRRPPPSWIFKLGEFGTFRHVHSVVPDIHLMINTSRELTSGFDFWLSGHLRMAMMHLPIKFSA